MNRSILIALVLAVLVVGWIASGQLRASGSGAPPQAAPQSGAESRAEPKPAVRVLASEARSWRPEVRVFGTTQADRHVSVRAETAGTVAETGAEKGSRIEEGAMIVRLDAGDRTARLARAEARLDYARAAYEAAQALSKKEFRSRVQLAESKADLETARAEVAETKLDLAHTRVHAPFGGVLDTRPVEIGDYVTVGGPVGTVIDLDPLVIVGAVSESRIGAIVVGDRAVIRLATGATLEGAVRYVAEVADPATRTFSVEVEVANADYALRQGLTAEIVLFAEPVQAHRISPAALTLSDQGAIGVKVIDGESRVRFQAVRIIADTPEGIWLAGLPQRAQIITLGQEFVKAGQPVTPVPDASPRAAASESPS